MNRKKLKKIKATNRALLISSYSRGYTHAKECYKPYSGATNGLRTDAMLEYERGFDAGLIDFYSRNKKNT